MHDDDIICGTCGKRNDRARVTCFSCKEILEEEEPPGFSGGRLLFLISMALAVLVVLSFLLVPILSLFRIS